MATPPIMKIGKIEPAPRNIREPLATVIPTMPTSKPTTNTPTTISHHGLPSGGGTLSGVGRTMFSGRTAGARSGVGRAKPCFTWAPLTLRGSYRLGGCRDAPEHRRGIARDPAPADAGQPKAPDSAHL